MLLVDVHSKHFYREKNASHIPVPNVLERSEDGCQRMSWGSACVKRKENKQHMI